MAAARFASGTVSAWAGRRHAFAVRLRAGGRSLSARDLNQPRRGEHQVNKSAVVVLAVAERARNEKGCFQLAGVEPTLDSTGPEGRIRMVPSSAKRCVARARNLRCGSNEPSHGGCESA